MHAEGSQVITNTLNIEGESYLISNVLLDHYPHKTDSLKHLLDAENSELNANNGIRFTDFIWSVRDNVIYLDKVTTKHFSKSHCHGVDSSEIDLNVLLLGYRPNKKMYAQWFSGEITAEYGQQITIKTPIIYTEDVVFAYEFEIKLLLEKGEIKKQSYITNYKDDKNRIDRKNIFDAKLYIYEHLIKSPRVLKAFSDNLEKPSYASININVDKNGKVKNIHFGIGNFSNSLDKIGIEIEMNNVAKMLGQFDLIYEDKKKIPQTYVFGIQYIPSKKFIYDPSFEIELARKIGNQYKEVIFNPESDDKYIQKRFLVSIPPKEGNTFYDLKFLVDDYLRIEKSLSFSLYDKKEYKDMLSLFMSLIPKEDSFHPNHQFVEHVKKISVLMSKINIINNQIITKEDLNSNNKMPDMEIFFNQLKLLNTKNQYFMILFEEINSGHKKFEGAPYKSIYDEFYSSLDKMFSILFLSNITNLDAIGVFLRAEWINVPIQQMKEFIGTNYSMSEISKISSNISEKLSNPFFEEYLNDLNSSNGTTMIANLGKIRQLISEDDAIIHFIRYKSLNNYREFPLIEKIEDNYSGASYACIIISKNKKGGLDIEWKHVFDNCKNEKDNWLIDEYERNLRNTNKDSKLYDLLWSKISSYLKSKKIENVYWTGNGVYAGLDLEGLSYKEDEQIKYVIDEFQMIRMNNLIDFVSCKRVSNPGNNIKYALFGDPEFNLNGKDSITIKSDSSSNLKLTFEETEIWNSIWNKKTFPYLSTNSNNEAANSKEQGPEYPQQKSVSKTYSNNRLVWSDTELKFINKIGQNSGFASNANLIMGPNASESELLNITTTDPSFLHISTHSSLKYAYDKTVDSTIFYPGNTIYTNSILGGYGLMTSGANNFNLTASLDSSWEDIHLKDGFLSVYEISEMNLENTDLVSLAICNFNNTVDEQYSPFLQEYVGINTTELLSQSFLMAGAKSVLASSWQVNGLSSCIITTLFYHYWLEKGLTKRKALTQAKKHLKSNPKFAAPYYWAGYYIIGND